MGPDNQQERQPVWAAIAAQQILVLHSCHGHCKQGCTTCELTLVTDQLSPHWAHNFAIDPAWLPFPVAQHIHRVYDVIQVLRSCQQRVETGAVPQLYGVTGTFLCASRADVESH